jgi:putative hemolysin
LVVCDGGVDNPVGVVLAKDMLDRLLDGADFQIGAVLRKPIVIPDTVSALGTMERLKTDQLGMALVMDEYGSFEGVVTASDVLEAIVGELQGAEKPANGAEDLKEPVLMDGLTPIDEVKSRLSLPDLPAEGTYHTLAGLLLALLRRVPRIGDQIAFGGWRFEVVDMDGRRVAKVRVCPDTLV